MFVVTKAVKGTPAPWMSGDIREAMKNRDQLLNELKPEANNNELRERYKTTNKYVGTPINTTKIKHYQNQLKDCKGNTSATRKVIGEIIPNQRTKYKMPNFADIENNVEEFNYFFSFLLK